MIVITSWIWHCWCNIQHRKCLLLNIMSRSIKFNGISYESIRGAPSGLIQIYNENAIWERNLILVNVVCASKQRPEGTKRHLLIFLFLHKKKPFFFLLHSLFLHHRSLRDLHFCNKIICVYVHWDPSAATNIVKFSLFYK